jgi:hypothetical protein
MFSAWKAKIATSVSSRAITVTGWNTGRKRSANQAAPRRRTSRTRLSEPAASGTTTKIRTE